MINAAVEKWSSGTTAGKRKEVKKIILNDMPRYTVHT
jgi:hypothetical protein